MKKSDIFWQTYLNLEKELIEVSKYIFVTDEITKVEQGVETTCSCKSQLETFSPHIADLLVRCCVQIEAISKELYHDIGGVKPKGSNTIFFDEDCLKEIDIKWETHNKKVLVVAPYFNLTKEENRELRPLKEAHKRQGTYWERCYQAVKHDRYLSMPMGNVKALLHAMAALYLLNIYNRNDSWVIKYQELSKQDFSLGSSLFAVKPPVSGQLWYGNKAQKSESPFVVTYQEDVYKRIEEIQRKESEALNNYWLKQPELREDGFFAILTKEVEKQRKDPTHRIMYLWELAKYRLHKRIPQSLPFEEKKRLLVNSEEWNGWIHLNNKHLTADELTANNIDAEINTVGICWGMELEKRFQKLEWISIAMNSGLCRVYIPE